MQLTWRRTSGTVAAPGYFAGTMVDEKVAKVNRTELADALSQTWKFFVTTIIPLTESTEGRIIQCHFNYSAGSINLTVSSKASDDDGDSGRVSLITLNFMTAWRDAAARDNSGGEVFRSAIHRAQVDDFKMLLGLIARCDAQINQSILGMEIRCTAVGCEKCLIGQVGSADLYVTSSAEMAAPAPEERDDPVDKKVHGA